MLRRCPVLSHGLLKYSIGSSSIIVGTDLKAMTPSNQIYYDSAKLRKRLDDDGYLYFKGMVSRAAVDDALNDVGQQMLACGWTKESDREALAAKDGFSLGIPFPSGVASAADLPPPKFHLSPAVQTATVGSTVMSVVRQVFGGAVVPLPHHTVDFSNPEEQHGFRMESVYMNRGTKLALVAWVPLHDTPLHMGGLCVARGSNSAEMYAKIRTTYGAMDVEGSGIAGDGSYTHDPNELLPIGKRIERNINISADVVVDDNPLVTTTFEAGDVVLMTIYTMHGFLTNRSSCWRVSCQSKWIMEGDDVGPDPRYAGADAPGVSAWSEERFDTSKYPKSMTQAKKDWGLL
jgi:ectoine hydroxylase-related dioxygenase (phytanoyl-CoA dioxygenase family)